MHQLGCNHYQEKDAEIKSLKGAKEALENKEATEGLNQAEAERNLIEEELDRLI